MSEASPQIVNSSGPARRSATSALSLNAEASANQNVAAGQPLGERLRTPAAAKYLGIGKSTLDKMRCQGTGPVFERVGPRAVVYSIPALDEYLTQRRATSTSEPAPQPPATVPSSATPSNAPRHTPQSAAPARRPSVNRRTSRQPGSPPRR